MGRRIGVLALQGAFAAHARVLSQLGAELVEVRTPAALPGLDGLVLPGGESTTMSQLLEATGLFEPLSSMLSHGLPVLGTCAGMILLANEVVDGRADQRSFGAIDIRVRRNGYGRQRDSFESDIDLEVDSSSGAPFHAVFIRAPIVEAVGDEVEVLARFDGHPVLCRHRAVTVASFHPELSNDLRVHEQFLNTIERHLEGNHERS